MHQKKVKLDLDVPLDPVIVKYLLMHSFVFLNSLCRVCLEILERSLILLVLLKSVSCKYPPHPELSEPEDSNHL